jgi:hypothetical protein
MVRFNTTLVANALQLLADEAHIEIRQYSDYYGRFVYYSRGMNIVPFIYEGGNFEYKATPLGIRYRDELRKKNRRSHFSNLGYESANAVVQNTVNLLLPVLELDAPNNERSLMVIRILEGLVRIGVRNYQDSSFLRDPVHRYMDQNLSLSRRYVEEGFYQPFLRDVLQRDDILAGQVSEGASMAGGRTDIMISSKIPIETKVVYPDDEGKESYLGKLGVGQSTQYASLSRIAFLTILDLRPRKTQADLSNIENDVDVITPDQNTSNQVRIVRVRHVCGYGRPSKVC